MTKAKTLKKPTAAAEPMVAALIEVGLSEGAARLIVDCIDPFCLNHPAPGYDIVHIYNGRWVLFRGLAIVELMDGNGRRVGTREDRSKALKSQYMPRSCTCVSIYHVLVDDITQRRLADRAVTQ